MSDRESMSEQSADEMIAKLKLLKQLPALIAEEMPEPYRSVTLAAQAFRATLTGETDRGCALMATAHLDDRLRELLRCRLVDDRKIAEEALHHSGPVGTFSSRIDFAYLLGLIPKNARRAMHLMRDIRNKFAHIAGPLTFDDPAIVDQCRHLYFDGVMQNAPAASKFRRAAMALLGVIDIAIIQTSHAVPPADHDISLNQKGFDAVRQAWTELGFGDYPLDSQHTGKETAME